MKKNICMLLIAVLLAFYFTMTADAHSVVNLPKTQSVEEAVKAAETQLNHHIETNRIYFKLPNTEEWRSQYSAFEGKYYPLVFWWNGTAACDGKKSVGYRAMIDDYSQGVYYADIPTDVTDIVWLNYVNSPTVNHIKNKSSAMTLHINIEGADEGEYKSLPEGCESFDGYICVDDPDKTYKNAEGNAYHHTDWFAYYGGGCYGNYSAESSEFISLDNNCLNPEHFNSDGVHIGGSHIEEPSAPQNAPADETLTGYYLVSKSEPGTLWTDNKLELIKNTDVEEYFIDRELSPYNTFKIAYYKDGIELFESDYYPKNMNYYNQNQDIIKDRGIYRILFRPDCKGDETWYGGCIKTVGILPAACEEPATEPAQAEADKDGVLYKERMKELYKYKDFDFATWSGELVSYNELYYHKDTSGEIEWALVLAQTNMDAPSPYYTIIGNRVFIQPQLNAPFATNYGIYDVKKDMFIDVTNTHIFNESDYPGFTRIFTEYAKRFRDGNGRLLGDIDGDDELTIIDATLIQRCDVKLRDWPDDDMIDSKGEYTYYKPLTYYSDFDRDGERNVVDATKLQRYVTYID